MGSNDKLTHTISDILHQRSNTWYRCLISSTHPLLSRVGVTHNKNDVTDSTNKCLCTACKIKAVTCPVLAHNKTRGYSSCHAPKWHTYECKTNVGDSYQHLLLLGKLLWIFPWASKCRANSATAATYSGIWICWPALVGEQGGWTGRQQGPTWVILLADGRLCRPFGMHRWRQPKAAPKSWATHNLLIICLFIGYVESDIRHSLSDISSQISDIGYNVFLRI